MATARSTGKATRIRVRMYRVGFGDFFLLTVPGNSGPAHVLIDCGVHAKAIEGAMDHCVADLKATTGGRLALVIATHYHADHLSGFASNYEEFLGFDVGMVWITNRLDPSHAGAMAIMSGVTSLASALALRLGARTDEEAEQAKAKVDNALGVRLGASGERGNAKALELLRSGFGSKDTPVRYYQGGDVPELPPELAGVLTAEILAPAPLDVAGQFTASDNAEAQFLALGGSGADTGNGSGVEVDPGPDGPLPPFWKRAWPATAGDYPSTSFDEFDSGGARTPSVGDGEENLRTALRRLRPDAVLAAADLVDGTLNNQSLVVLFTCRGKKLLFVGDAQWGNWAYWLYRRDVRGSTAPTLSAKAAEILGSIDFYKVGHHGSTNATPIPAVGALNRRAAAMVSTANGAYGSPAKQTEVPRTALLDALAARTKNRTVRSDWVGGPGVDPDPDVRAAMAALPKGFSTSNDLYIDYVL